MYVYHLNLSASVISTYLLFIGTIKYNNRQSDIDI